MSSFNIAVPCRVKPSSGEVEAQFVRIVTDADGKMSIEQWVLDNSFGENWVTFPAGTEFTLIARVEKTDTYVLAVHGEEPKGLVLRRAAYDNLKNATEGVMQEFLVKQAQRQAEKTPKAAPTKPAVKTQPKVITIALDPEPAQPEAEVPAPESNES